MLRGLQTPPPTVVSVARQIDYSVAYYTTDGVVDEDKFSVDILARYVAELQSYEGLTEYISKAVMGVRKNCTGVFVNLSALSNGAASFFLFRL